MSADRQGEDRQWKRAWSLIVSGSALGDAGGQGLDLSALRVTFEITKGDVETPNAATVMVWNLSPTTGARIGGEFTRVVLAAGYGDRMGTIFDGGIVATRRGRDGGINTWLEITAADGDRAYTQAVVSHTLAAGARPADQVRIAQSAFAPLGAQPGHVGDLGGQPLPRGKVLYGMARDVMRTVAEDRHSAWSIQDGRVQILPWRATLPGEAVVLTHRTGLIDTPEQTDQGIKVRALLNPGLRIGGRIRLDNASVLTAHRGDRGGLGGAATSPQAAPLDRDGVYRIIRADYTGDTHGQDWYVDLLCIAMDDTARIPLDQLEG